MRTDKVGEAEEVNDGSALTGFDDVTVDEDVVVADLSVVLFPVVCLDTRVVVLAADSAVVPSALC